MPRRIVDFEDSESTTGIFSYDGNMLKEINYVDGGKTTYTYKGNLIVKEVVVEDESNNWIDEFTYDGNKLKSSLSTHNSVNEDGELEVSIRRDNYTYNSDGTVTEENYEIDPETKIETKFSGKTIYTSVNGNLTKEVIFYESTNSDGEETLHTDTIIYEYDDKKNPFANVAGFNNLPFYFTNANSNNLLKDTRTYQTKTNGKTTFDQSPVVTIYSTTYTDNNFLAESKNSETDREGSVTNYKTQFFYE